MSFNVISHSEVLFSNDFEIESGLSNLELKNAQVQSGTIQIKTNSQIEQGTVNVSENFALSNNSALEFSVLLDPVADDESEGYADAGISIGMPSSTSNPNRFQEPQNKVYVELAEYTNDRTRFTITIDGECISFWNMRRMKDHGRPEIMDRRPGTYLLKIIAIDRGDKTGLRFFIDHGDRPLRLYHPQKRKFLVEWELNRKLTQNNYIGLYARDNAGKSSLTVFDDLKVRKISINEAEYWMPSDDFVMANIDYDHPQMKNVKAAKERGDMDAAKKLFTNYFRTRSTPKGPAYDREMARETAHGKPSNWKEVSDYALEGIYSKLSWFHGFSEPGELSRENGMPKWSRDPGFLGRHYHWVVMTHAWERTNDGKYAKRLGEEVIDWVKTEPTFWFNNPNLGGQLHTMDGTVIAENLLWTGNIGRRLELTWWQMFEVMRKSPDFSDAAIFAYLDGVIRQCRLLLNHTVFLSWDDSGLHGAMALTKSSMLFPMSDEAAQWNEVGWDRVNYVVANQFHPDGSHVSLSTGYNWATIRGIEHFYIYLKQNGAKVPKDMEERVSQMYYHPLAITRPNFGSIDLNDGGWSAIDNPVTHILKYLPDREKYLFFETRGKEGRAPNPPSMYFENAGHALMRTGWGSDEQYLFFGNGPWGASHGKYDGMNIYTAFGNHLMIRNAGRGAYSGVGNTHHAGKSLSFNIPSPDWAQQQTAAHHHREMDLGFNPPKRRWVSDSDFDYAEGSYDYGWHAPGTHIKAKHVRQVVFVKGDEPKKTGYYLVVDTIEPEEAREYTWYHPWQLDPNDIKVVDGVVHAKHNNNGPEMRIIPIDPTGKMDVEIIRGQTSPELLGFRVYGEVANPFPVPTYSWKADNKFSNAWLIMMQNPGGEWPIESVKNVSSDKPGELKFELERKDGGVDIVSRKFPGQTIGNLGGQSVDGDFGIVRLSSSGSSVAKLEVKDGSDSVAASIGFDPAAPKPNLVEQFGSDDVVDLNEHDIVLVNASFESPKLTKPVGAVEGWESNSRSGTGMWPLSQADAEGDADGDQVAAVHKTGNLGQLLRNAEGKGIAISPGAKLRVSFDVLRHEKFNVAHMGVYLKAGHKEGTQIANPVSFMKEDNQPGRWSGEFNISEKSKLEKVLPKGWEKLPMYLQFLCFNDRVVLDNVRVETIKAGRSIYGGTKPTGNLEVGELSLLNASFEQPKVNVPSGVFADWDANSASGTGTYPASQTKAEGDAVGNQVGVIHSGGYIGQILRDNKGKPVPIKPGAKLQVSFQNLRHEELNNINFGIYLLAGSENGGRITEAYSFRPDQNQAGEVSIDFTIHPANVLDVKANGWDKEPLYLKFQNFSDRMVIDNVRVTVIN